MLPIANNPLSNATITGWDIFKVTSYTIVVKLQTKEFFDSKVGRINELVLRWTRSNRADEELACHTKVNRCPHVVKMLAGSTGDHSLKKLVPQLSDSQVKDLIRAINEKGGKIANEVGGSSTLKDDGTWTEQSTSTNQVALFLEAMHGNFEGFLKKIDLVRRGRVFQQALIACQSAYDEIHNAGVAHLDPHPRNVFYRFVYESGPENTLVSRIIIKVGDFGNATLSKDPYRYSGEFDLLKRRITDENSLKSRGTKRFRGHSSGPHSPSKLNNTKSTGGKRVGV